VRELQECLETKRRINEIDEKINTLKAAIYSPKNQIITGMPRGGNNENVIERYLIKLEDLKRKKSSLEKHQSEQWEIILQKLSNINEQERHLLYMRFMEGLSWNRCVMIMQKKYINWNLNKAFRVYGKINKII
jgi:DNA-directed RNA polymerase specialized sigma subunit